ncbi:MAG: cytochrome c biogenesis CcdA family protein [Candidatus Hodarchaeales archaeon]|jgi:cytochrome c biogenesis protein CcdA
MLIFGVEVDESIGLPLFFFVGLYIALSPCLFPIMPLTVFRIMQKKIFDETGQESFPSRKMGLQWVTLIVSGIIFSFFIAILITQYIWSSFGFLLIELFEPLTFVLGIILVTMGFFLLFPFFSEKTFARIPIPQKISNLFQREEYRQFDLFLIGFGYSFIALPCALPVFLVVFSIIPVIGNAINLMIGMSLFSIGLFIPYLILVFVTAEARTRAASLLAEKFRIVEIITGILIIIFGLLFIWPTFGGPYLFLLGYIP